MELNSSIEAGDKLGAELMAFCQERLPKFKCPRSVDFTEALPRSDAGKVYRKKVREGYWKGYSTT